MLLANQGSYQFGEFQLNLDLRVLARRGEKVILGSKAYDLLTCLVMRAGEVVSKADLLATVWPGSFVEEGALSQQIFSLRKALGDKADYILTAPGQGYRFSGVVRFVPAVTSPEERPFWNSIVQETHERTHMVVEEPLPAPVATRTAKSLLAYSAAAIFLLAAGAVAAAHWPHRSPPSESFGIVMGEFTNSTSDPAFDLILKRAVEIDLEQSPYVDVLGEREGTDALQKMGVSSGTPVSAEMTREVCERTNRQAVLTGNISTVGGSYWLTLKATDCQTGKTIASAKAEAADKAKVLTGLDVLAEQVRSKLGEPTQSVKRFDVPLQDATTGSLEALKAYSLGKQMQAQGKPFTESLQPFLRAVQLDPQFAQAYGEIASTYYNLSEPLLAANNLKKAFDLKDRLGAKEKLMLEAHYYTLGVGDLLAGIKTFQLWADTYPHDWTPWLNLANWYTQLGQYGTAIAAGQQAVALGGNPVCYVVLARAYKDANRFREAKSVGEEALRHGKDTMALHWVLFEVAFDEHDATAMAREETALAGKTDSLRDYFMAKAAAIDGKFSLSETLFRREIAGDTQQGLTEQANNIAVELAEMEQMQGYPQRARSTLDHLDKSAQADPDYAAETANLGDVAFANRFLAEHMHGTQGTYILYDYLPRVRAAVATTQGRPLDAIAAMEAHTPYGMRGTNWLLELGDAYLRAHRPQQAADQYQMVLANPGAHFHVGFQLARLGLARSHAQAGDKAAARREYGALLAAWKDADPDLPVLKAAKMELAALR